MDDSKRMLDAINQKPTGNKATIKTYLGVENRKDALRGANYVVNAIQVGLYDPCTVTDFEVPKKYGLRQTIADTLGIGGIFRALRTIPVMQDFADDMDEVCPNAWFLNYTNPMAMLTGYMQRYTGIKTVGLCHSVQVLRQPPAQEPGYGAMTIPVSGRSPASTIRPGCWRSAIRRATICIPRSSAARPRAPRSTTIWCAMS